MSDLHLHLPDEPTLLGERWAAEVLSGRPLDQVLCDEGGLAPWLYARWTPLSGRGCSEEDLAQVLVGYRRELWLWLMGERTWSQAISGLIGRLVRRVG